MTALTDEAVARALADLAREDSFPCRARGTSMEPALRDGTAIEVRARRRYWPGDVLVVRNRAGFLAAHRLLGWTVVRTERGRAWACVTAGETAAAPDTPVSRDAVLGRVVAAAGVAFGVTLRDRWAAGSRCIAWMASRACRAVTTLVSG